MSTPQYEFTEQQNALIGSLASKMGVVGLFFVVLGVLNVVVAVLTVLAIYRTEVPNSWVERLPEEMRSQAEKLKGQRLPANNQLWGVALNAGVVGLFYLLMGGWTRSSAASFQQIVSTQGRDISHLMNALAKLHSMYALVYTLLMLTLLLVVVAIGLTLISQMGG